MVSHLRSAQYRFTYTFRSGHQLAGILEGDRFHESSSLIFNLRSLQAICLDMQGSTLMKFDTAFGQFNTALPEVVLLGSHANHGSFFTFNYRGGDASIYNAVTDTWVTSGWEPERWKIEKIADIPARKVTSGSVNPAWARLMTA